MIIGTGIDIIEIERVKRAAEREHFVARVLTQKEKEYWQSTHCAAQTLAGAFAAKEAVAKAFGTGIGEIGWNDIEILHTETRRPYVVLHNRAQSMLEEIKANTVHISISHSKTYAIAQAILESE